MKLLLTKWYYVCWIKVRWAWFHISPRYIKFSMDGNEMHFQDMKKNVILSNYEWVD